MPHFIIYDADGNVLQEGTCQEGMVQAQAHAHADLFAAEVASRVDPNTVRVIVGEFGPELTEIEP